MTTTLYTVPPITAYAVKGYTITQAGTVVADADLWAVRSTALNAGIILNSSPGGPPQLIQVPSYYNGGTGAPTNETLPVGTQVTDSTGVQYEKKADGTWAAVASSSTSAAAPTALASLSDVNTAATISNPPPSPNVLAQDTDGTWKLLPLPISTVGTLGKQSDVDLTGLAAGAYLMYASDGKWRPTTALPTVPAGLRVSIIADSQVTLAWNAASGTGSSISSYIVRNTTTSTNTTVTGSTSTTITGLTNGTTYTFTVAAVNAVGTGTASSSVTATPTSGGSGTVLFNGGFETGDLSQWALVQPSGTSGITVYTASSQPTWPAPAGGTYAARFNTTDGIPTNSTGSRVQLAGNAFLHENDEVYINFACYIPSSLPSTVGLSNSWMVIAETMGDATHGSPEAGAWTIRQDPGNPQQRICLAHGSDHNYDETWGTNIILGSWFTLTERIKFSKNSSVGFIEIWLNGVQQTLNNGTTRRTTATMTSTDSAIYPVQTNYRAYGAISGSFAIYHDKYRVATTYAAATA